MKKFILLLVLITMAGCQKNASVDNKAIDTHIVNAKISGDYIGTYKGILPCVDCQGIETEISINENTTFSIKTKYLKKGNKVFVQKGHFTWNKKGNIIILTDKNGPNQYLVGKNKLTQLDSSGKIFADNLTNEYILSKQPTHTSEFETDEDTSVTVDLDSRIATSATIEKVNPAVGKYPLAGTKWKLIFLSKKQVDSKGKDVYYLKLNSKDGRFVALSGCNNIIGYYVMPSTGKLAFSGIVSTKMACADMASESYFFTALAETKSYKLDKKQMILFGDGKAILAKFEVIK